MCDPVFTCFNIHILVLDQPSGGSLDFIPSLVPYHTVEIIDICDSSQIAPWKSSLSTPRLRSFHVHHSGDSCIGSQIPVGPSFVSYWIARSLGFIFLQ